MTKPVYRDTRPSDTRDTKQRNPRVMARSTPRPIAAARQTPLDRAVSFDRANPPRPVPQRPEYRPFAIAAQRLVAAGERPHVRVAVVGVDGILVRLVVDGIPGTIAHARTRRRAREVARAQVASILGLDPFDFDLEVRGA